MDLPIPHSHDLVDLNQVEFTFGDRASNCEVILCDARLLDARTRSGVAAAGGVAAIPPDSLA